jgi:charged multivesicular body protein 2A
MASVTMAMSNMNRQFNLPKFQEVIFEFERQSEMMGLKEDMVDTAVDETVDNGCEEVEANKVVQQVSFASNFQT